jgi:hypothetical protein
MHIPIYILYYRKVYDMIGYMIIIYQHLQTYSHRKVTIKSHGENPSVPRGLTPLHSSGVKAQLSTLKMLLALKADPQA